MPSKTKTAKPVPDSWGSRLYRHTTDGGAEYLCSEAVPGTDEGAIPSRLVVRLDGEPEYVLHDDNTEKLTAALRIAKRLLDPLVQRTRTWTGADQRDYMAMWSVAEPEEFARATNDKEKTQARNALKEVE